MLAVVYQARGERTDHQERTAVHGIYQVVHDLVVDGVLIPIDVMRAVAVVNVARVRHLQG
jgi:hypothetical protein